MTNARETDLLAYILGGLVIAISCVAITVASSHNAPENQPGGDSLGNPPPVTQNAPAPLTRQP
jgi:hypothetical protein